VLKLLRFYLSLLTSGGVQRYEQEFGAPSRFNGFRALIVTTTEERLENIRTRCGQVGWEPPVAKRFIWLATREAVQDAGLLDRPWRSLDPEDDNEYRILPSADYS
jgi:hypothetical protein